ncbi:hypothetical protein L7F22_067949 [Adiantum nelumboides]|nr:hypothetical protein [Adiantum nelumboides]
MIRPYNADKDADRVLDIWLKSSIQSHDFIAEFFWRSQIDDMRNVYLPNSETFVLEKDGQIKGFLSLHENRLAALFIDTNSQGHGFGKELLNEAKKRRQALELTVYSANTRARSFYQACGFKLINEQSDPHTGHSEQVMRWQRH